MKIYGIDLGTTNSAIGRGNKMYGDLVKSIANIKTKEAGNGLVNDLQAVRSYKIDISCGVEGTKSRIASALVLKELCKQVPTKVENVVIGVPAYFTDNERSATKIAAESIGLTVKGLINEPTAAALYYSNKELGLFTVFDLGGGTFDVSIVDTRMKHCDVQATDGLKLGGDDFDSAIMQYLLKKYKIKSYRLEQDDLTQLKLKIEQSKIFIQKTRDRSIISFKNSKLEFTPDEYIKIMKVIFKPAISKLKRLVTENIIADKYSLLFVGGSTRCPYLCEWVEKEVGQKAVPMTYDPDWIVVQGVALFSKMLEDGIAEIYVSDVTKAFSIGLNDGTCKIIIPSGSMLPIRETLRVSNSERTKGLIISLYQGDNLLQKCNTKIGELRYAFGEEKEANTTSVKVTVNVDINGLITLSAKELGKEEAKVEIVREGLTSNC